MKRIRCTTTELKSQRKKIEELSVFMVKEEAADIIASHSGAPLMKVDWWRFE